MSRLAAIDHYTDAKMPVPGIHRSVLISLVARITLHFDAYTREEMLTTRPVSPCH